MSRMISEKRLKKLEGKVKKITPRDGMTEAEQIAQFGKTFKQMTDRELMEIMFGIFDEKNKSQQNVELERMSDQELLAVCKKKAG